MTDSKYSLLKEWIEGSGNIVFLGGAGVSTESGIPDFRGPNGLYRQKREIPLEKLLSHDFFIAHPDQFYRNMRLSEDGPRPQPGEAHKRLAALEQEGKLKAIITQNVDGLHQLAGSRSVLELHGNHDRFYCLKCGRTYTRGQARETGEVPTCSCGGLIRPDVVFFGEPLPAETLSKAVQAIQSADMLIVGGTSLVVYPAAGLIDYYTGDRLVLINEQATPYDSRADLIITDKIGKVFAEV